MISPCIKVCAIDPETRLCSGCGRTLTEIASWASYSEEKRQSIMRVLATRRAATGVQGRETAQ